MLPEMIFAGDFMATIVQNTAASTPGGVLSYNPSTDTFNSNFAGGVYYHGSVVVPTTLGSTPL